MKVIYKLVLLFLLILTSISTVQFSSSNLTTTTTDVNVSQTNSTINFHHDFEGSIQALDYGYYWNELSQNNQMNVEITNDSSYSGNQSLLIDSLVSIPPTSLYLDLNLNYEDHKYFSLYIYIVGFRNSIVRVNIADKFGNQIGLDFGQINFGWEPIPIFDMNKSFLEDNWDHLSRNLTKDVEFAISYPRSPYTSFVATTIVGLEIFQPWDNGLHLNYNDDIMFDDQPIEDIEFNGNTISTYSTNSEKIGRAHV